MAEDVLPSKSGLAGSKLALLWKPRHIIAAALTGLAGVSALIVNLNVVTDAFQPSLSGVWQLTLAIESASLKTYEGMTATYQLNLVQDGNRLTGNGEKIKVNGKGIPLAQHQQIKVSGAVSGGRATLAYTETAGPDRAARTTAGEFDLQVMRAGCSAGARRP